MAASGIEIIRGQLNQLKTQREQVYNEQLLPLDDAIASLEKLVAGQNGKAETALADAAPASRSRRPRKTSAAKSVSADSTKSPARRGRPPGKAPVESKSPAAPAPTADKAKAAPAKKSSVKLKGAFRGKSVDEAVADLFAGNVSRTWTTEDVVSEITSPVNKAGRATYVRSLRLSLSNGASQGKWKKVGESPATYASKDYQSG